MSKTGNPDARPAGSVIGPRDILFECPSCGKSLVVEDRAAGMVVPCPRCNAHVIVPPAKPAGKPAPAPAPAPPAGSAAPGPLPDRLAALLHQLKEMQAQRTEISNRVTARLNEVTRDLVALSRLEAAQQQLVAEWAQVVAVLDAQLRAASSPPRPPAPPAA